MLRSLFLLSLLFSCQGTCEDCEDEALLQTSDTLSPPKDTKGLWPPRRVRRYGARDPDTFDLPTLSDEDLDQIEANCEAAVQTVDSELRTGGVKVVMQIVIMPRATPYQPRNLWDVGARPHDSSLLGSRDIARGKAFTALGFSSNENALSSRIVGVVAQPGADLYGIQNTNRQRGAGVVTFGGGIPLYKDGKLVGAVGVSGDSVKADELVAVGCGEGFEVPATLGGLAPLVDPSIFNGTTVTTTPPP